jgi:hypothetical protein
MMTERYDRLVLNLQQWLARHRLAQSPTDELTIYAVAAPEAKPDLTSLTDAGVEQIELAAASIQEWLEDRRPVIVHDLDVADHERDCLLQASRIMENQMSASPLMDVSGSRLGLPWPDYLDGAVSDSLDVRLVEFFCDMQMESADNPPIVMVMPQAHLHEVNASFEIALEDPMPDPPPGSIYLIKVRYVRRTWKILNRGFWRQPQESYTSPT